jgi:hypothetical protein
MSEATLKGIEEAIEAHVKEEFGENAIAADWLLSLGLIMAEPEGTYHQVTYVASDSAMHAVYGVGMLALEDFKNDCIGDDED